MVRHGIKLKRKKLGNMQVSQYSQTQKTLKLKRKTKEKKVSKKIVIQIPVIFMKSQVKKNRLKIRIRKKPSQRNKHPLMRTLIAQILKKKIIKNLKKNNLVLKNLN